jgi:hypothetical protein
MPTFLKLTKNFEQINRLSYDLPFNYPIFA